MDKRIKALKQERSELAGESERILTAADADNRDLTDVERARDDEIHTRLKAINGDLGRFERQKDALKTAAAPLSTSAMTDADDFVSLGEQLQAVACASDPRMKAQFGSRGDVLVSKLQRFSAAASGASVGDPETGGHLVRKQFSLELFNTSIQASLLAPLCRRIGIGADADGLEYPYLDETSRATGSRFGGVRVYRKAEGATVAASQPKIGKGELRLEDMMGIAYATGRLMRDAPALQAVFSSAFRSEISFKIDDEIYRGSGAGQCLGLLNSPALVTVAAETSPAQGADTVVAANVQKMFARMPARLMGSAVWLINQEVWPQLWSMVIGNTAIFLPGGNLSTAPFGMLLGRPIVPIEQASAPGDVGDIMFAAMQEYLIIEKDGAGVTEESSMHVRFIYDEMTFRWTYAINGQPIWTTALTPYKGTASSISPYVTLAAR